VNCRYRQARRLSDRRHWLIILSLQADPRPAEVAAEAILYASHHDRREVYVGMPTVKAILGNKLFPGLLDHYLAHTGYKGQQTNEPEDPSRPDNLYEPVAGDHGAHGRFDNQARAFSPQLWTDLHRCGLVTASLLGVAALAVARFGRRVHA
jgi:hypothetical protein